MTLGVHLRKQHAVFLTAALSAALPTMAIASEQVDVCAQYVDTGQTYHVTATSTYGTELNQATHSFNYIASSRYVVIFWAQNQASIIDVGAIFNPSSIGSIGTDQEGRFWTITAYSPALCWP
jgi:hypothetical protein